MRSRRLGGILTASALLVGCTLLTDVDGLSSGSAAGGTSDAAPDGASMDAPAVPAADGGAPETGTEAGIDGASPSNVVFEDDFDDGAALPRAWGYASGPVAIAPVAGAPSGANALRATSPQTSPTESKLHADVTIPKGTTVLTCSLSLRVVKFEGGGASFPIKMTLLGFSLSLAVTNGTFLWYGPQQGNPSDIYESGQLPMNQWRRVSVRMELNGKTTMRIDDVTRVVQMNPFSSLEVVALDVGILTVYNESDLENLIDSVECTAE